MKKYWCVVLLLLACSVANAQFQTVFTMKHVYDKFGDETFSHFSYKTRLVLEERKIIIEEKGKSPQTYILLREPDRTGSPDRSVSLGGQLRGHELHFEVFPEEHLEVMRSLRQKAQEGLITELEFYDEFGKYRYDVIVRVIDSNVQTFAHAVCMITNWKTGEKVCYGTEP